jgi:hypothetical protein
MQVYGFSIKDQDGDLVEFEYDPKTDAKNMTVWVVDIDEESSVYVNVSLADAIALKSFLTLAINAMAKTECIGV